jgi:hypothetical protein
MTLFLAGLAAAVVEPVLDGRCDDHLEAGQKIAAEGGATAFVRQTRDFVWLCFAVPEGSYASLDLRLEAPGLRERMNLHASAQLGEWAADDPQAAPKNASSPIWWRNVDGWWASITPFNGMIATPDGLRPNFRPVRGREVQLSKRRFGLGEWTMAATISDVAAGQESVSVRWPKSGSFNLKVTKDGGAY